MQRGRGDGPVRAGIVGLGVIGRVHLAVLAELPGVDVAYTVDPVGPGDPEDRPGHRPPHFGTLSEAVAHGPEADLVVLATPTGTHLDLVGEVLGTTSSMALSEKPLTDDPDGLRHLRRTHAPHLDRLRVVNHFAFSPEVEWGVEAVGRAGWGAPESVLSTFNDPYVLKTVDQRRSYVSSWVDSGANQLSMLPRFTGDLRVLGQEADADGLRSATSVDYAGGSGLLVSNWHTGDSSKQTRLRWPGDCELLLDHTAMTGYQLEAGRLVEHVGHGGRVARKITHYRAMYRSLLADPTNALLGLDLAEAVADLLAAAAPAVPGSTRWVTTQPFPPSPGACVRTHA